VGNIYRAEILFVARVHPSVPGLQLTRDEFDRVWAASVDLMQRGYEQGSILTVDPAEAAALGRPALRRWIYNSPSCGRCMGRVAAWDVAGRTCYACPACQPAKGDAPAPADAAAPKLFNSHCAGESLQVRLATPAKLRVAELRNALGRAGRPTAGKKAELVARLEAHLAQSGGAPVIDLTDDDPPAPKAEAASRWREDDPQAPQAKAKAKTKDRTKAEAREAAAAAAEARAAAAAGAAAAAVESAASSPTPAPTKRRRITTAGAAAAEKVAAGESRAVEHVAEWEVGLDETAGDVGGTVGDGGTGGGAGPEPRTVVAKRGRRGA